MQSLTWAWVAATVSWLDSCSKLAAVFATIWRSRVVACSCSLLHTSPTCCTAHRKFTPRCITTVNWNLNGHSFNWVECNWRKQCKTSLILYTWLLYAVHWYYMPIYIIFHNTVSIKILNPLLSWHSGGDFVWILGMPSHN